MTQDHPRPSSSRLAIFQYSCRTLLLMMVVVSAFFAWWSDREKVTKKFQRLDDKLTVLQAALGDSVWEDERDRGFYPYVTPEKSTASYWSFRSEFFQPPTVRVTYYGSAPSSASDAAVRYALYELFNVQKEWLMENFIHNYRLVPVLVDVSGPPSSPSSERFPSVAAGTGCANRGKNASRWRFPAES